MKKWLLTIPALLILIGVWVGIDLYNNGKIERTNARDDYSRSLKLTIDDIMIALEEGEEPDYSEIDGTLEYIKGRYDCSDFRIPSMIRILYSHSDKLPADVAEKIRETATGFKFWMDQPGDDSMCYWSENHQLLFSSSEYLLGHYYGDEIFTNMDIRGSEHSEMGKKRVLTWLEQRFLYGFTEWYSSTYYVEDIAPLAVLIDFAPDEEVRTKASIVMDLLIYDLATQNYKGTFTVNSGRMYEKAKMSGQHSSIKDSISLIWPRYNEILNVEHIGGMEANFKYVKRYEVPEVLRAIGYDQNGETLIKASTGLNLSEFEAEGLNGTEDPQIMMQFNSEAFTNPEVIDNTIKYIDRTGMFSNEFLNDFKLINLGLLKTFKLSPAVSRLLDPLYDGTAIQRANTYMYRTPDYAMSTAQAYHPGMPGDQHSLFSLTINNDFNIFVQNPAASLKPDGALGNSPNYWVGNGYHPHTVQEKNINMSLWVLPEKLNPLGDLAGMARKINNYTHAFFPRQYMEQAIVEDNYAFGKIGDVYVALTGKSDLVYKPFEGTAYDEEMILTEEYDLIQEGRETYWITETGTSRQYGDFETFCDEIRSLAVSYEDETLNYRNLQLTYKGDFLVDNEAVDLEYDRFDSKYVFAERKSDVIEIDFDGKSLLLDFNNSRRVF
ncbi:hypothetical protein [Spirochaeta isovalerica]|uniref:Uncharacterized protein n=1 Tax=Spirochaeta isovalerica TaxID=150 RepID=A0A841RCG4_9SPIO|nr:hypothetical protein [Spirochaeta isovalerica]MBB6480092.1 hypothetical protein [Spirochaeta isovalerica]